SVLRIRPIVGRPRCRMPSTRRPRGNAVLPVTRVTCGRSLRAAERVLEAQVQEDAGVAFAGPDPDGHGQAGNDLEPAREVVRPADAGAQVQRVAACGAAGPDHVLYACPGDRKSTRLNSSHVSIS